VANGLMKGMSDTEFAPNGTLTRGMMVTVLYRLAGEPEVTEASSFTDVAADAWYADAIAWAQAEGIVNGITETTFAPNQAVTREQIAAILWRAAGQPESEMDLSAFADADQISAYAREAMEWACEQGIFIGDAGKLDPKADATRAQFAVIMLRTLDGEYTCG
ncbi:MAG: S-layer homology domain-containing protein, partial [Oscillospiraceae bacterium]|nr:S-layer homology domain-containing protein [Oscillospiraceae bacterium]